MIYLKRTSPEGRQYSDLTLETPEDISAAVTSLELITEKEKLEKVARIRDRLIQTIDLNESLEDGDFDTAPCFLDEEAELIIDGLILATQPCDGKGELPYVHPDRAAIARELLGFARICGPYPTDDPAFVPAQRRELAGDVYAA